MMEIRPNPHAPQAAVLRLALEGDLPIVRANSNA